MKEVEDIPMWRAHRADQRKSLKSHFRATVDTPRCIMTGRVCASVCFYNWMWVPAPHRPAASSSRLSQPAHLRKKGWNQSQKHRWRQHSRSKKKSLSSNNRTPRVKAESWGKFLLHDVSEMEPAQSEKILLCQLEGNPPLAKAEWTILAVSSEENGGYHNQHITRTVGPPGFNLWL